MSETKKEEEGHRIDYFIGAMRQIGCRFDSGQAPLFSKRGALEFWEGGFFYRPGGIEVVAKVTLDHNFITVKSMRVLDADVIRKRREEIHLLMTANQCHYYFEGIEGDAEKIRMVISKYIYAATPPQDEVQIVLDMLAHGFADLQKGIENGFEGWRPKFKL